MYWDYAGPTVIADTSSLTTRRPWYSMVYNDAVQGLALSPYGMTDNTKYQVQHLVGQKQYELSNHLGNVQATISDLPVKVGEAHTEYHAPALPAVYDYYPFGMLMPDRYTSDTSSECVTVSQTKWVTTWVTHCYTPTDWVWPGYTSWGSVSVSTSGGLQISAGENSGVQFDVEVLPFEQQDVYLQIEGFYSGSGTFELQEYHNGQWTVLGSASFDKIGEVRITCRPRQAMVRAILRGPYYILAKQLCVTKPVLSQETVLVDICDTDGDKYRFGFNGQEKVNEWSGVGNFMDYGERGYDSRTGRLGLSIDPLAPKFPWQSPYAFAGNCPILFVDVEGKYKYPKNKAKDYAEKFPMLTKYLAENIQRDIKKSSIIQNAIVKNSYGGFTKNQLVWEVAEWDNQASPEITFEKGLTERTNAVGYTPDSKGFKIDWDYAKTIEGILSDNKTSKLEKQAALLKFYETVLHETTHVGDLKDGSRSADEVGRDAMNEIYHFENVTVNDENGKEVIIENVPQVSDESSDSGDLEGAKGIIERKSKAGKFDVLPTLPTN
jgi:hypothetical protein